MKKQAIMALLLSVVLAGCAAGQTTSSGTDSTQFEETEQSGEATSDGTDSADEAAGDNAEAAGESATEGTTIDTSNISLDIVGDYSKKALSAANLFETSTDISFADDGAEITGNGATYADGVVTISTQGTYILSGSGQEVQLVVNAPEQNVQLILQDVSLENSSTAPIYVQDAKNVYVTLAAGSTNTIRDTREEMVDEETTSEEATTEETTTEAENTSDAATEEATAATSKTTTEETEVENLTAAIYSKADLFINGSGALTVEAGYNDGITSKDDLQIISGTLTIQSVDDGIVGKDSVSIRDGEISITSGGDAIKSSNSKDTTKGYVVIDGGTLKLDAGDDGIDSVFALVINDGTVDVINSYEGLECLNIVINGGDVNVTSTDDGINISDSATSNPTGKQNGMMGNREDWNGERPEMPTDEDGNTMTRPEMPTDEDGNTMTRPEMPTDEDGNTMTRPEMPTDEAGDGSTDGTTDSTSGFRGGHGGKMGNGFGGGGGGFEEAIDGKLVVNGGNLTVNADGDGLDSNGDIQITGGTTIVFGPTDNNNGALDYSGTCEVTGGILLLVSNGGMEQNISDTSTQSFIAQRFDATQAAGTQIQVVSADGTVVCTTVAPKSYKYVAVSAPDCSEENTSIKIES